MVSEALFNVVVLALIISVSIQVSGWSGWYDDDEIEKHIESKHKRQKNYFKDVK